MNACPSKTLPECKASSRLPNTNSLPLAVDMADHALFSIKRSSSCKFSSAGMSSSVFISGVLVLVVAGVRSRTLAHGGPLTFSTRGLA